MFYFSEAELDGFITEDVPFGDLTTQLLGIDRVEGEISYAARSRTVLCGTEETRRIFDKLGLKTDDWLPTGSIVEKGDVFFKGSGAADALHTAWRACGRILENACGIATRTADLVRRAKKVNPDIVVAATRKSFPGTKKLASKAVLAGGGILHRLGLSETVLIFGEHIDFMGGLSVFLQKIDTLKKESPEKKIVAEANDIKAAQEMIVAGVDVIQCDKFSPDMLKTIVSLASTHKNPPQVAAAGNVTGENIEEITATGVTFIVTSAPYFGKPADIGVTLLRR